MTYLYHDHGEGENVCLLTMDPFLQDLWGRPPWGVTLVTRGAPYGVQVLCDHSEAEIREAGVAGTVHENVILVGCRYGCEVGFRVTYPLEVSVDHITGVEVAETLSNIA
jgi:hypothetical protein